MTRLASRAALRTALAAAAAAAALAAIAVLGSSPARAPNATPPVTVSPSATPSEVARPSPLSTASPTSDPLRAPVEQPTFAPDGRTGDPALDALIDRLLGSATAALGLEYPDLPAHEEICDPGCIDVPHPARDWASRLSGARRSLYAVFTGEDADAHVVLTVDVGKPVAQVWLFKVASGRLTKIDIYPPHPNPGPVAAPFYFLAAAYSPSPASQYERFYVLPPRDALPQAPRVHALSTRTGVRGVDTLLAVLESRDPGGIGSLLVDPAAPLVRECQGGETRQDAAFAARWSEQLRDQLHGIHSVTRVPAGFQPPADHLVILYRQLKPYWWTATGILERGGRVAGLYTGDWGCWPEELYPPDGYLVPPPAGGIAGLDPSRRSGIAVVDAVLDAIEKRDQQALGALIDYTKDECGSEPDAPPGTEPPPCPSGAPPGTLVDILPSVVCHYSFVVRDRAPAAVIAFVVERGPRWGLYAVVAGRDEPGTAGASWRVVTASDQGSGAALTVTERGVAGLDARCGPFYPDTLMGSASPSFLLPPP